MRHSARVHVLNTVKHLKCEEAASVLTHGSHQLAKLEEEATLDALHHDVDEVGDHAAGGLHDGALVAELEHLDDAGVLQVLENCDFVLHGNDLLLVAREELLFENLDCDFLGRVSNGASQVDLAGVALAEGLMDLVLLVEDGPLLRRLLLLVLHSS